MKIKFCPECGSELNGNKFCPKCGYDAQKEVYDPPPKPKKKAKSRQFGKSAEASVTAILDDVKPIMKNSEKKLLLISLTAPTLIILLFCVVGFPLIITGGNTLYLLNMIGWAVVIPLIIYIVTDNRTIQAAIKEKDLFPN